MRLVKLRVGWAAVGDGWAVVGETREEAKLKYYETEMRHAEIMARDQQGGDE